MIKTLKNPCHGCEPPKRSPTCHYDGLCNGYIEWSKEHTALLEKERLRKEPLTFMIGNTVKQQSKDHRSNRLKKKNYSRI